MNNQLCPMLVTVIACTALTASGTAVAQSSSGSTFSLSFGDALRQMQQGNRSLQIADKGIETARAERDKLNALWYPSLQGAGTFVHLSEKIEVKQPLSPFTDPAKDFVHNILPDDKFISGILDQIGSHTLAFPLAPRNLTSVGLTAEWVVFSGGKRIRASKIGNSLIDLARENREQTDATQRTLLAESYFGLRLAREVARVRQDTYNSLKRHYENALKLEAAGMIDKAGRLFAQVNMDEAQRALEAARKEVTVVQSALRTLLNLKDTCSILPTSPLFINTSLPVKEEFVQTMQMENYIVNQLQLQSQIARQQLHIDQSGYLPDIALFGKQTLYAHGIQSNLVPRTMVGVGFTWNLFDGLAREKRIRQSKIVRQTLALGQEKAKEDLSVGIDKLYTQLQKAQDNVRALNTTIELSEELVRIRKKSFAEGMATSTEVVDAETMLATVRVARLAACYEYDVALMNLLALCGTPEHFEQYIVEDSPSSIINH
ncbi:TolC family protein [Bacteroides fluxus]|uniref:TolC family protein n=1 Tax=Bacteroides fluxus TaxID=626930 RepID=UPI0023A82D40|nr:TolC family protein [Bacteroides fluxus]